MTTRPLHTECSFLAASIAPEDLRRGDFVAVLSEIVELPSFLWNDTWPSGRDELVRLRCLPAEGRIPQKVKAVCLPFVFVKLPCGKFQTIDIRLTKLVRLEEEYARTVWKAMKPRRPHAGVTSRTV
ncbi:MAG: hypothetical protein K1X74_10910 [Pirellulales bacterium]|nr:hypothetical protein [Pirellulales bacterium]